MKKLLLYTLLFLFSSSLFSQIPAGYYNTANGLTGSQLKTALFIIIKDHTILSYPLWSSYYTTDVDNYYENDGTVLDMYSEKPSGTDPYNFSLGANQCGNYSSEGDCYNNEHSFPKSWFNDVAPMNSDLFHIYPTDGKVNGQRSNWPFGEVSSPTWTSQNGSKLGPCSYSGYTGTVFEPIDEFKGDFARTYFYMATCYEDKIATWESNTPNSDAVLNGTSFPCFEAWMLNMLIEWNAQDPISQKEIDRNDAAYAIQGNRNPFIDHPEWVECIWGSTCTGVINFTSTPVPSITANQLYTYNITYNVNDESETIICTSKPAWLSFSSNTTNNTALLTGIPTDTDLGDHSITLELSENEETVLQSFTISVSAENNPEIINENFTVCPASNWTIYSVSGNKDWQCVTNYMEVNAFGGDVASNDWFISPGINLDDYTEEVLNFQTWTRYTDNGVTNPEVRLKYSTNYSGTGNPESANWTEIAYVYPAENSQVWTNSGNIDLAGINGTSVYFAFVYTSSGTGSLTSTLWEVDNILLTGKTSTSTNHIPYFTSSPITTSTQEIEYSYSISAIDADADDLNFSVVSKPNWLTLTDNNNGTALLSGTPTVSDIGNNFISISVSDGTESVNQEFTIVVSAESTSVNEIESIYTLSPNPTSNYLNINSSETILSIMIFDIFGKEKLNLKDINNTFNKINIEHLVTGMYLVEIKTIGNHSIVKKFIKE